MGSSLGLTDQYWWELIGKRVLGGSLLIIFKFQNKVNGLETHKKGRMIRSVKAEFLSKSNLSKEEKEKAANNIIVHLSKNLFEEYGS
ncbi:hypothetical protein [Sediminicola luteus]|uniref:Uncharacterized protein n=1 Tax=Sediminicola luteus TaxID=319238 RepID=A0A2A4G364_9FLAO|nr:hypothetical protein [Sediminicola luteus]PCE62871.1 hypothetical protein B7P33_16465 [Sediminicola luteus]